LSHDAKANSKRAKNCDLLFCDLLSISGMEREHLARRLQRYLLEHIPISEELAFSVTEASLDEVVITAPLAPNVNHHGTAFGGSISAAAILAGWSLVYVRLEAEGKFPAVVIRHSETDYIKPIDGPFRARARLADPEKWTQFLLSLSRRGKARTTINVEVEASQGTAAYFQGTYVALWRARSEQQAVNADWNTALYLRFERERTQPSRDLLARITLDEPHEIVDLGCGPGNSTAVLRARWPSAKIVGIDHSPAMLEQAKKSDPQTEWRCQDIGSWRSPGQVDLIFANASLHWLPDHASLLRSLMEQLRPGGILAFQVPALYDQPATDAIRDVSALESWKIYSPKSSPNAHPPPVYHDYLASQAESIDLWETIYHHQLPDHEAIIDWYRSTGLRPYLQGLPDTEAREEFQRQLLERFRVLFPRRANGAVLLPFRRLFVVAKMGQLRMDAD
jgi:trans-aconitate 2-methyltransferase